MTADVEIQESDLDHIKKKLEQMQKDNKKSNNERIEDLRKS